MTMDLLFSLSSIQRFLYLVALATIVYLAQYRIVSAQAYWFTWTAFTLSLMPWDGASRHRLAMMLLLTGLVTAVTVFLMGSLPPPFLQAMVLVVLTFVCVLLGKVYSKYFVSIYVIYFLTLLACGLPVTYAENGERFFLITLATVLTTCLYWVCRLYCIRSEWRSAMIMALRNLQSLNTEIFSCVLQSDYADALYLYERRLHMRKKQVMQSILRLRTIQCCATPKNETIRMYSSLLTKINLIYGNMLDYAQIRRRVSDYTTFSLCSIELSGIAQAIHQAIDHIILSVRQKKIALDSEQMEQTIKRLDDNYQHVLQIAAREPLVFVLFIDSLNSFCQQLKELNSLI